MLEKLYRAIQGDAEPSEIVINGRSYTTGKVNEVLEPAPKTIEVKTLTGLVDYLKSNVDALPVEQLLCHVESPSTVTIYSPLVGSFEQRKCYITATLSPRVTSFDRYIDAETFNVWLQSGFVETPVQLGAETKATDKGLLLSFVGNVKSEAVAQTLDDGISQETTIRSGIASVKKVVLPNPVTLRPYRTFTEVEQPASSFIFRAKVGNEFALFEADGGAWKSLAMKNIKSFMEFEVTGLHVIA